MYKPCSKFEGKFETQKAVFLCNDGLGHPGQFVYIRDDREEQEYFGLCEVEVFEYRSKIGQQKIWLPQAFLPLDKSPFKQKELKTIVVRNLHKFAPIFQMGKFLQISCYLIIKKCTLELGMNIDFKAHFF